MGNSLLIKKFHLKIWLKNRNNKNYLSKIWLIKKIIWWKSRRIQKGTYY